MEIATKRGILKKNPANDETTGFIDFACLSDSLKIRIYGTILIDYDDFYNFDAHKIKEAMEVLLNEKCRENNDGTEKCVYRA